MNRRDRAPQCRRMYRGRASRLAALMAALPAFAAAPASAASGSGQLKNVTPPRVVGATAGWQPLSADPGTWSEPSSELTFVYQWQRCRSSCVAIPGASRSTYTPSATDAGAHLRVLVGAGDGHSQAYALSSSVGPISAGDSEIDADLAASLKPSDDATSIALELHTHGYRMHFTLPAAGRLAITWYQQPRHGGITPRTTVIASGSGSLTGLPGSVVLHLTRTGRKLIEHHRFLNVILRGSFTPSGQRPLLATVGWRFG